MPVLQPAEPWEKTGRYAIDELFKLEDRKGSPMVLAMTHEEAVTYHVAREVRSYRDLPLMLFHLQTKERDEPRPRAGVLRTREFTMKDAYSFDRDEEGLARSYELQAGAYDADLRPLRPALVPGRVRRRDDGRLRRPRVHGALRRRARTRSRWRPATPPTSRSPRPSRSRSSCRRRSTRPSAVATPGLTTVEEVSGRARAPRRGADQGDAGRRRGARAWCSSCSAATTASTRSSCATRSAPTSARRSAEEIEAELGPVGYIGPVGAEAADHQGRGDRRRLLRLPAPTSPTPTCAASSPAATSSSRRWTCARSRPATPPPAAARSRSSRRSRSATSSSSAPATRSRSAPPTSTRTGEERPIVMGSYGIGPARIVAAAIEQGADERGIVWPRRDRPLAGPPRLARQGGRGGARGRRPPLRGAARGRRRGPLRRPRRRPGGEADRRRAARLPAAGRRRPPRPRQGRRRGERARPRRRARAARRGGRRAGAGARSRASMA